MKIEDFKIGDIITYKCGNKLILSEEDDIKMIENWGALHEIIKIERYVQKENAIVTTNDEMLFNTNKCYILETIYERKDNIKEIRKLVEEYEELIDADYGHKDIDLIIEIFNKILNVLDEINSQKS